MFLWKKYTSVPDTGTSQYWLILEHFWCTSIAWKCNIYVLWNVLVLFRSLQYWNAKMVQYCPILMYQYLGLQVYFFRFFNLYVSHAGLALTLFVEQPQYVGIFSPETGVRVSIHSADVKPTPEDIGLTATTGMATSIGVRQVREAV